MKSEATMKLIMNSALDAIICIDTSGAVIMYTLQAEKLFGWKEEEIKGKPLPELIIPVRYRAQHLAELKHYLETGDAKAFNKVRELEAMNREGKEFPVEITLVPVKQNEEEFFCVFLRDISARKKTEEDLRKSEHRYRSLIEQASDAIMTTDFNGNFIDVNESLCRLLGYDKEELLGMNIKSLIDTADLKANPIKFDLLSQGQHVFNERRMLHKNGAVVDVEANVKKISEEHILAIARDITERKKTERTIRESEARYRALVENATEALVVFDAITKRFVSVSESAVELFKMSKSELLKVGPLEISPEHQPDGRLSSESAIEKINLAIEGKKQIFEWMHFDKAGNLIPCEIWLVRLPSENQILVRGSIIDISERKKADQAIRLSEQKYKLLFFENPLPMLMMSIPDMKFIDVNQAAIEQYGYSREEFLTMTSMDIRPKEDLPFFLQAVKENDGGINRMGIFRHKKKDGSTIRVEVITHRILHEGRPAWLALANNVTETFLAEEKLKQSHKDLRLLTMHLQTIREEERTTIAREIHDELGQQLTGLKMDIAWINRKTPVENKIVRDKIATIIALVDQTVKTVRQISADLRPGILDDLGIIEALDWQSNEFEKRTGVRCRFKSSFNEMDIEKSLATGIFRVYQETLTNVARHANATEINATFELENNDIVLKVQDNGRGFDEKEVKEKRTLGLLGMKERAMMFGGKFTIESVKGKGTAVTLQVPLHIITGQPV